MAFPDRFSAARRYLLPFDPNRPEFKCGMCYGVPLMVGWTVLLIWAAFDPTRPPRRLAADRGGVFQ